MPKTKTAKTTKRRTKVKDLSTSRQELTGKDMKKIKGGTKPTSGRNSKIELDRSSKIEIDS